MAGSRAGARTGTNDRPERATSQGEAGAGWRREGSDLLRGLAGGFLVGVPLLFTMETWWIGETIAPSRALVFLAVAYLLNLGFGTWSGFRRRGGGSDRPFADALEATALAAVAAAVTLALLHQIRPDVPLGVILGRIAVNTVPVSLGVAIANHLLAPGKSRTDPEPGEGDAEADDGSNPPTPPAPGPSEDPSPGLHATLADLGAAFAGAIFLSFSIALTEEIPMLATAIPTLQLPVIILFSLGLTYGIVFIAGFGGQDQRRGTAGLLQHPSTETIMAYLVSLATSALMLWLFGQIGPGSGTDPFVAYEQILILGLPAAVGAAAGRLAV